MQSATLVEGDQRIDVVLKKGETFSGDGVRDATRLRAFYVTPRGPEVVDAVNEEARTNNLPGGFTDQVPQQSVLLTLLGAFLPILLLLGVFWFLMSQAQGGGSRVMSFGKSRAKMVSKEAPKTTFADVAGADEAVEEPAGDQGVPRRAGQVPGGRREDPQGRAALRPARHRQDPAGPCGRG
nr:hypothetical protein [Angustibacter aerolatus]